MVISEVMTQSTNDEAELQENFETTEVNCSNRTLHNQPAPAKRNTYPYFQKEKKWNTVSYNAVDIFTLFRDSVTPVAVE